MYYIYIVYIYIYMEVYLVIRVAETLTRTCTRTRQALHNQEVPCAVCKRIAQEAKTLFLPGTVDCPTGFSIDYRGACAGTARVS